MAPSEIYRGGNKAVHFLADFQRFKEYQKLCRKEGKSYTQDINEYITSKLERNAIAQNDMPDEAISCLGYTPKPVQQKIDDIINNSNSEQQQNRFDVSKYPDPAEWVDHAQRVNTIDKSGEYLRYFRSTFNIWQIRFNQINSTTPKIRRRTI